jgi:plasmid stability protein
MLICLPMRTTLNLDDSVYRRIKALAALRGESVTAVVEESLRATLLEAEGSPVIVDLPVSTRRMGLTSAFAESGLDLSDTSAVMDFLDQADR